MNAILLFLLASLPGNQTGLDFDTEIVPVLTRYGCNTGACHGSAAGRGGFRLSLFGSRPEMDYLSIAREFEGRRINRTQPNRSLLVRKPGGEMEHGGDQRFELDSQAAERIRQWIEQGAKRSGARKLESISITPTSIRGSLDQSIPVRAVATFNDNSQRDVTEWIVLTAQDESAVHVDADRGTLKPMRQGRHLVTARYLDRVVPLEVIVPLGSQPIDLSDQPRANWIDDLVLARLELLQIAPSPRCNDEAFIRRVSLDLTGRLPSPQAVTEFLAQGSPDKRRQLVDRLIESDAFVDFWTYRLGQWFRVGAKQQDTASSRAYYLWLRQQVQQKQPLDQMVVDLVGASGDTHQNGPANFYRTSTDARLQAEFFSQAFMGSQLRCANCHDHPLDRWTQDDYHGLAAIFGSVRLGRNVSFGASNNLVNPRDGNPAIAKLAGSESDPSNPPKISDLSQWLTQAENPYFARTVANRIWQHFLGRGLVDPIDDMRATNPPTHPQLLDRLADHLKANKFDFRSLARLICASESYQRSSISTADNRQDSLFLSHALPRPLSAEVLADAISQVTGRSETYAGYPPGTPAVTLFRPNLQSKLLEVLGRCEVGANCGSGASASSGGVSRQLQLINGPFLNQRITHPQGRLAKLLKDERDDVQVVERLYLSCFSRRPTADESKFWQVRLERTSSPEHRRTLFEDMLWALLTSNEFINNQ